MCECSQVTDHMKHTRVRMSEGALGCAGPLLYISVVCGCGKALMLWSGPGRALRAW